MILSPRLVREIQLHIRRGKGVHMQQSVVARPIVDRQFSSAEIPDKNESYSSGVSWAAVIGGAFVSASLALILLSLSTGLGFSAISPWSNVGASASTVGKGAIAWLILTQIMASAMVADPAGRLRHEVDEVYTDEVYFRYMAHGFLVWAVGLVITASLLATAATSLAGGPARRDGIDGPRRRQRRQCSIRAPILLRPC